MAYLNVAVTDGIEVLQELATFAPTAGWTVHRNDEELDPDSNITGRIVTVAASGGYVTLRADASTNRLYLNGHRGLDTGAAWNAQPDQYYQQADDETHSQVRLRVNPLTSVHLFGGTVPTPYLYLAIEVQPGYYRHVVLGYLQKFGTALGGLFWDISDTDDTVFAGSSERNRYPLLYNIRSTSDQLKGGVDAQNSAGAATWFSFSDESGLTEYRGAGHPAVELSTQGATGVLPYNGRTVLQAPLVLLHEAGLTPFGTPPNLRYVMLDYYQAGDEITLGTDVWMVFPMIRRGAASEDADAHAPADEGSNMVGIAYLKD